MFVRSPPGQPSLCQVTQHWLSAKPTPATAQSSSGRKRHLQQTKTPVDSFLVSEETHIHIENSSRVAEHRTDSTDRLIDVLNAKSSDLSRNGSGFGAAGRKQRDGAGLSSRRAVPGSRRTQNRQKQLFPRDPMCPREAEVTSCVTATRSPWLLHQRPAGTSLFQEKHW